MDEEWLEALLQQGMDIGQILDLTRRAREELHSGGTPRILAREIIADHRKLIGQGVDPRGKVVISPDTEELLRRRQGNPLVPMMPDNAQRLFVGPSSERLLVLTDVDGFVLGMEGSHAALAQAGGIGMRCGIFWTGPRSGANAVRSSVQLGKSVFMIGHQHLLLVQCSVACAVTPVQDGNGQILGFLDVICPARAVNIDLPRLVREVAGNLGPAVDRKHRERLNLLRKETANLDLRRYSDGALVIDWDGWVAVRHRWETGRHVSVPKDRLRPGRNELDALGSVLLEPVWGGWLVRRPAPGESTPQFRVIVQPKRRDRAGWIRVIGPTVDWRHALAPQQAVILVLLARSGPDGLTPARLERLLYPERPKESTVRSAFKRARNGLRGVVLSEPYRFSDRVQVTVL